MKFKILVNMIVVNLVNFGEDPCMHTRVRGVKGRAQISSLIRTVHGGSELVRTCKDLLELVRTSQHQSGLIRIGQE